MRIQHNIMAMNAYRNYTNNVSAMKKNLEKLSSGYKINRAGDDAAGLAISEKMRAQITGLQTAQKNAKDGISLVQTAEGALTEVHDMLNRMVELATQSANGTYSNETDREQLQKEINQLRDEINRIADSSNFNGIKLLDGSMSTDAAKITGDARIIQDVYTSGKAAELSGTKTFLDGEVATSEKPTVFEVDFTGLTAKINSANASKFEYTAVDPVPTAIDGIDVEVDAATAGAGDVKVEVSAAAAANKQAATSAVGGLTITGGEAKGNSENGITFKFVAGDKAEAAGATAAVWDEDTKTVTVTFATDATATTVQSAIQALGDKTGDGGAKFGAFTATGTISLGTLADAEATTAGGATQGDVTVTLTAGTGTGDDVYTKVVKGDDWTGSVEIEGTNGVTATIDATTVDGTAAVASTKVGTVAETNAATADNVVDFTFKIGNTEFTVDATKASSTLADGDEAADIAAAVKLGLDAAKNADGTVTINNIKYNYEQSGTKVTFTLAETPTEKNIAANYDWDVIGIGGDTFNGNHTAGVVVKTPGSVYKDAPTANTVFKLEAADIKDGTTITIDGTSVTLAVGKNSTYKSNLDPDKDSGDQTKPAPVGSGGYIDLTSMEEGSVDLNVAISKISEGFKNGTTDFIVGVDDTSNGDTHSGLTVHKRDGITTVYDTKAKLASVFEITKEAGRGLTLQIGDTADSYNQLKVSITDCHVASLGLSGIDISTQEGATDAISAIKAAINKVSDVRGTLGATQNRLDHTINNLGVMTENIQDAESTIRDVDIAEEMMAYTKNNILIQSAQAMLAQANQVPQGVLQLLG